MSPRARCFLFPTQVRTFLFTRSSLTTKPSNWALDVADSSGRQRLYSLISLRAFWKRPAWLFSAMARVSNLVGRGKNGFQGVSSAATRGFKRPLAHDTLYFTYLHCRESDGSPVSLMGAQRHDGKRERAESD
jgi:hypothetical protein